MPDGLRGIERWITKLDCRDAQSFREFCAAHTDEELRTFLAGAEVAAVARDASAGPVPFGLEE